MAALIQVSMPGESAPAVSFDTPIAMLMECHRRVERQCLTLEKLTAHVPDHGSNDAARDAAESLLRYFDHAAKNHHADEELDLFPALLESVAGADATCLHALVGGLSSEHTELETRWRELKRVLETIHAGLPALLDPVAVHEFVQRYARHIACEETEVFPMAERLLSEQTLQSIGRSMRDRRNPIASL